MSAKNIITSLEQLLSLHQQLYDKAKKKTEVIKTGDMEGLKEIVAEERKFIKIMNAAQKNLMGNAQSFLLEHSISSDTPTLRDCLEVANEQDGMILTTLQSQIVAQVTLLKKQNDLNQQLLQQSLAFVQMSIDLLTPDIETYNYERPNAYEHHEQHGRSLFDSNA